MARRNNDEELLKVALTQHGAFAWTQAVACGFDSGRGARRVEAGAWRRMEQGTYVLTATADTWERSFHVAQLAVPGSTLAGRSALQVRQVPGASDRRPLLVVAHGRSTRSSVATVRQSKYIVTEHVDGFRVASVEQAIFDLAREATVSELERAIDHTLLRGLGSIRRFQDRLATVSQGRWPGIARIRPLIEERAPGFVVPQSELERHLFTVLARAGVPDLERQAHPPWAPVDRRRFDALSARWRVIFEADGRRWHARVRDFDRDRRRDLEAAAHGYQVLRFTWAHLTAGAADAAALVRQVGRHRGSAAA